jgi:hypothetical protein
MRRIITEPQHRFPTTKCNTLKTVKTPMKGHGKAVIWKCPRKYSKKEINWNDAHHSQLI